MWNISGRPYACLQSLGHGYTDEDKGAVALLNLSGHSHSTTAVMETKATPFRDIPG